jgi:hypothetical protein
MTKILLINGFGQKPNSLENSLREKLFCNGEDLETLDYSKYENFESLKKNFKLCHYDIVVAWSLGGQIAIRLIEARLLKTKLLCLYATPAKFVGGKFGMSKEKFEEFKTKFELAPVQTLEYLATLIAKGHKNEAKILAKLELATENFANLRNWLIELEKFDLQDYKLDNFPKTIYKIGLNDAVVNCNQREEFFARIKNCKIYTHDCGHAVHLI